ncbi:peptidoglycan DD-metalloendopeptidase family protein [Gaiella sp.]|uniref:peptidoglycan DD-metalloendopeptidase family protein n=1 Tax=Gaiella sp. TaxID=2663207 RepID=UPI002E34D00D|nr:peptidoglycan DD-metalloendopeptidase family protein [Gaiella sp.]HEX5584709.1 peptidoglycan DD-metalloendopeptidase family protein [Gaiella sp.]
MPSQRTKEVLMHRFLAIGVAALLAVALCGDAAAWSWPADGAVLRPFALGDDAYAAGQHRGIDVAGPDGSEVRAPATGVVTFAGSLPTYGRGVTILTADGYSVTLVHLGAIGVAQGQTVSEGSPVGTMGSSGTPEQSVPSVHLGIRHAADEQGYVDPLGLLPPREATPAPSPDPAPSPEPSVPPAPVGAPAPPASSPAAPPNSQTSPSVPPQPVATPVTAPTASAPTTPGSVPLAPATPTASASPAAPVGTGQAASSPEVATGVPAAGTADQTMGEATPQHPAAEATGGNPSAVEPGFEIVRGAHAPTSVPHRPSVSGAARAVDPHPAGGATGGRPTSRPAVESQRAAAPSGNESVDTAPSRRHPVRAIETKTASHARVDSVGGGGRAVISAASADVTNAASADVISAASADPRRRATTAPARPDQRTRVDAEPPAPRAISQRSLGGGTPVQADAVQHAASATRAGPADGAGHLSRSPFPVGRVAVAILLVVLSAAMVARRVARRIGVDGALLPHHADLLRELDPAHRARVHDRRRRRLRTPSAAART